MIKRLLLICLLLTGISSIAEEVPVTITPVKKITTADKNLHEGDYVEFKNVKTGDIITGIIKELTPNGFAGEQASILINNFQDKATGKKFNGQIYIKGGEHLKYQELANNGILPATYIIRGGEVILTPEKSQLVVFFNDFINSEDTPVKITPAQKISTCHDETEVGDKIKFKITKDIYKNGKLYIKKDTPIYGLVDYVSENGWSYDNAQMDFKKFYTKNTNGKKITIDSPLSINSFDIIQYKGNKFAQFFNYCGVAFRGKEVEIIPTKDEIEFNIWLK